MSTLYTFGDSILDCAHFNDAGVTPGGLFASNDDQLFPEFRDRDLSAHSGTPVKLEHRAVDGATAASLRRQLAGARVAAGAVVMLTIGGNDVLQHLLTESDAWVVGYASDLRRALWQLSDARVFVANVYDPSFGDDGRNPFELDPAPLRRVHARLNSAIAEETARVGAMLVDLHSLFLTGEPSWLTQAVEPSLVGASEVRRAFLAAWEATRERA